MDYKKYVKDKKDHPFYTAVEDTGGPPSVGPSGSAGPEGYLGVKFECCGAYTRAYRNREGTAYLARCPRCMQKVTIGIDPREGTNARFFVVRR